MIWKSIHLDISEADIKNLLKYRERIGNFLERKQTAAFSPKDVDGLWNTMSDVLDNIDAVTAAIRQSESGGDHIMLNFQHENDEIRNLPWHAAKDQHDKLLSSYNQLFTVKSLPKYFSKDKPVFPARAYPLKILIVISSPEGVSYKNRLSYEEEELSLLQAFDTLITEGLVELDFTDDASLETLKEKLDKNPYHILHFSGHATYDADKKIGHLAMEHQDDMTQRLVTGKEFAETLNSSHYKIPLVVISSCQSAQGHADDQDNLSGITNQLMRVGVPAVVAMGWSISDHYAMLFTAKLYELISNRRSLHQAFKAAIEHIKATEYQALAQQHSNRPALQWMIPGLYVSQPLEQFIDRDAPYKRLALGDYHQGQKILKERDADFVFVGRRKDRRRIFKHLLAKQAVLLKGQGGVGKSAMAEHLVHRYLVRNPNTAIFAFDETNLSIPSFRKALEDYLKSKNNYDYLATLKIIDDPTEKIHFLLGQVKAIADPFLLFDNLETFQEEGEYAFRQAHQGLEKLLHSLVRSSSYPMILTGRYPLDMEVETFDLNQVGFADYWRKARYLKHLTANAQASKRPFIDTVQLLYQQFGGNYRTLELYDQLLAEKEDILVDLKALKGKYQDEVLAKMSTDLVFEKLIQLLDAPQKQALLLLAQFQIPVTEMSLTLQGMSGDLSTSLAQITDRTLIEETHDSLGRKWYYVTPLIRQLLQSDLKATASPFYHEYAGRYHLYIYENDINTNIIQLNRAFEHFLLAENKELITQLGNKLSFIYKNHNLFRESLLYGMKTYDFLQEDSPSAFLNRLGQLSHHFGQYDDALSFYEKSLKKLQKSRDKSGEGAIINNISQIFAARGEYDTALSYLEQSLSLNKKIGDKSGKGTILNNIAEIYRVRGDYDMALGYLEQSLSISQEIGDKSGEGITLNNISQIFKTRGYYNRTLSYLEQSLSISQEIGDKSGESTTLNNLAGIYRAHGDYDMALGYLEQSLSINQEIGEKSREATTLNNIGQIYSARGDYARALSYLEQSLSINQEIGDKSGEATTLNNLATTAYADEDYDTALRYLEQSLSINQEIGDKSGEGTTLNNISQIYSAREDYDRALSYLEQSLSIRQEIGNKSGEATTLDNISQIYFSYEDYNQAFSYLEQSLRIRQEIGDKSGEAHTLFNLFMTYINPKVNQPEKGLECLMQVIKINETLQNAEITQAILGLGLSPTQLEQLGFTDKDPSS